MFSKKLLVSAAVVCACAGFASATTTKIKAFGAIGGGVSETPHVDGVAIIKFDSTISGSIVHIHMQDLSPNGTYGVAIVASNSGDFDHSNPFALDTNASGNGTYDVSLPTVDLGSNPTVYIYEWDLLSDYFTINGFDLDQFRAVGTVP